jgi:uncharacterized membrane protein YdjX (TVP38/TMEM64 family)
MMANRVIVVLLVAAVVIGGSFFLPVREWFVHFEVYVRSMGALGPILVAAAYVLCTVLFIPGSVISLGAGTLFGLKTGLLVVIIGANLGALCAFLLARTFLRDRVVKWAATKPTFRSLDQAIGREDFKMVLLMRLSPLFPFVWLNYLLGLTAVRTGAYILANLIGMLPGAVLYVYLGATARDVLGPPSADFYRQILNYVGLAATMVAVVVITRFARKALRAAEERREDHVW